MLDRRQAAPDRLIHASEADDGKSDLTRGCVVRNSSAKEVPVEFDLFERGRSFLTKMMVWRDRFVDAAFSSERAFKLPASDLDRRLRKSEKKKRQLQRRINQLLRQG